MWTQIIELDCPPGDPRPGDLTEAAIKNTGLELRDDVTQAVKRLEKRGLIQTFRHGRYVKKVVLTPKGQEIVYELKAKGTKMV
jgi:DNA-binding MarR family transcriptional regulator